MRDCHMAMRTARKRISAPASPGGGAARGVRKTPTGINGLDEITSGGFPSGRPTLICGGPGSGKTLMAMEFLVRGAVEHGEPGVFVTFEETEQELKDNVASLGFDLDELIRKKKLAVEFIAVERHEIEETGDYDLEGLFIRLDAAVRETNAKRIVLDTIEAIFAGLSNQAILRAELRRLFRWLKDRGITAVVTGERGEFNLTRQGLEEFVSDCVVVLDHRVVQQISTRRLRIVKYRGSTHGTNEYPFLIGASGISVLPITSLRLDHPAPSTRISSGVPELDSMLGDGGGYFAGSTVLVSGTAGAGKTILAATFADATCRRGGRCLYFAFEESESQIIRNMASVGLRLGRWGKSGQLRYSTARPSLYGLEMHLVRMHHDVQEFKPDAVIIDPLTSLAAAGSTEDVMALMTRMVDFFKVKRITAMMTSLSQSGHPFITSDVGVSSLTDTWIVLRDVMEGSSRHRAITIVKSRGMAHSDETREFKITDRGIRLVESAVSVAEDAAFTSTLPRARRRVS
jgi:circadian clock protein KaiC